MNDREKMAAIEAETERLKNKTDLLDARRDLADLRARVDAAQAEILRAQSAERQALGRVGDLETALRQIADNPFLNPEANAEHASAALSGAGTAPLATENELRELALNTEEAVHFIVAHGASPEVLATARASGVRAGLEAAAQSDDEQAGACRSLARQCWGEEGRDLHNTRAHAFEESAKNARALASDPARVEAIARKVMA